MASALNNRAAPTLRLLFLETTAGCNLECIHCRRLETSRELMKSDLTTDAIYQLIDSLALLGKPILVLSGGEPLMRPDIFDIAARADQKGLPVALATNGTLITPGVAAEIKASGIRRVAISLDGPTPDVHDAFRRQPGAFEAALRGFNHLKSIGVGLQINTTVTRHNADLLDDIYRRVIEWGAQAWHLFMLVPVGCGLQIGQSHQLEAETYERILERFADWAAEGRLEMRATCAPHYYRIIRQRAKRGTREGSLAGSNQLEGRGRRLDPPSSGALQHAAHSAGHPMAAHTKGCLAGTGVAFVSHRGEVFPCGYLPTTCGNIRLKPFHRIWEESNIMALLRDTSLLDGKCGVCEYRNVCGGCRARAYEQNGDYCGEEPFCLYEPRQLTASVAQI